MMKNEDSFKNLSINEKFDLLLIEFRNLLAMIMSHPSPNSLFSMPQLDHYPSSISEGVNSSARRFLYALEDIHYLDNEDGRSTRSYQGVFLAQNELYSQIDFINELKSSLSQSFNQFAKDNTPALQKELSESLYLSMSRRWSLSGIGLGRINIKACVRKIQIIEPTTIKLSYSESSKGKSIKRVTAAELREALMKRMDKGDEQAHLDYELTIPFKDNFVFARVQNLAPYLKVNTVYKDEFGSFCRRSYSTSMPVVINENSFPDMKFVVSSTNNERLSRYDTKIESEPFIKSLRIYKYI